MQSVEFVASLVRRNPKHFRAFLDTLRESMRHGCDMDRDDLSIEHLAGTSALLNGVAIPGRSLEGALGRYAFNLFVGTPSPEFPLILRGTGTALKFRGRYLFVCTQHQLEGIDRSQVGMLADDGGIFVTSGGMRHYTPSVDTDARDLVVFDFTEPVAAYPDFQRRFFQFETFVAEGNELVGFLLTGYPFDDQKYELAESNHIGIARRQVLCTIAAQQPSDTALVRVLAREPLTTNSNGMSGGSAFAVHLGPDGFHIDFAGIVVRGGATTFYVIKANVVLSFLQSVAWLEAWSTT